MMNKPDILGQQLQALNQLRSNLAAPETHSQLIKALQDSSNRIIERAGELIAETEDGSFAPDLIKAYRRLKRNPLKKDPGCLAKTAIMKALVQIEYSDPDLFRDGIATQQLEPHWQGERDSAAELRGISAIGMIHFVPTLEVLNHCAMLLVDPWPEARLGAAQALGALRQPEAGPLLRMKLKLGDAQAEVHGECCSAFLKIEQATGLDFLKQFLSSDDADVCVQTALALGEANLPGTFDLLRDTWGHRVELGVRESLLLCIGLLRSSDSQDFLLSLIHARDLRTAADAVKALRLNGEVEGIRQRTEAAVEATGSNELQRLFQTEWR